MCITSAYIAYNLRTANASWGSLLISEPLVPRPLYMPPRIVIGLDLHVPRTLDASALHRLTWTQARTMR